MSTNYVNVPYTMTPEEAARYTAPSASSTSRLVTAEGKIACSPFPDMSVKTSLQGQGSVKVARIENKASLVRLNVLFCTHNTKFFLADAVLVRGDQFTAQWAKEKFEFEGKEFILVPVDRIEAVLYPG